MPRYLQGKDPKGQPSTVLISSLSSSAHQIGIAQVLFMFTLKPEAWPNICRISRQAASSVAVGFRNSITSSAKKDSRFLSPDLLKGDKSPHSDAAKNRRCSGSMTRMNNMGDKGSPCR